MSVGSHKRSQGEAAFTQASLAPQLPALLRSQFQVFSEDNLRAIERRLTRHDAARAEEQKIQERCARFREQGETELQRRIERIQKRTARHASAAGVVEERRLQAEFRQLCRW
ncbi:hypothetical protein TraAM80_01609 [Trypanosoma rangeli]|uniref:Uncharacterized protein n=1 Tax=Trypanosoma rangeli TaxID=5698 RepID=A0A3R7LAA1_TRYRA|nr:uncharacterized protein TraAM80_01609 [Trypanosoma rangeli]RNF10266.1 hypothetical protein TraAM80_01609 [Trypanosoma rangeli]|eukprot:RNF10266.1 hypothetical protein TraAM80_01609 [Trypanosoma rangeli]